MEVIWPQMKEAIKCTLQALWQKIQDLNKNSETVNNKHNNFELLGYDFMIDEDLKVYLIEVNTNPCLETDSPLLSRIVPELLEASFK